MAKKGYITRYVLIIKKVKQRPHSSYEEIRDYINLQVEYLQMQDDTLEISFSKRTLQRDLKEIRELFGIDIQYSRSQKGYAIIEEIENLNFQRMMENFETFNALNYSQDMVPFLHLENRRPTGSEHLYGILHAIKNKFQMEFHYHKFGEETGSNRTVEPYAVKEFKNRWYLIAKDLKDNNIKTFGLDRMRNLSISQKAFSYPKDFNINTYFQYSFGVISSKNKNPKEVVLSFTPFQGKYIKTLPLHPSQKIIKDNAKELVVQLKLVPTYDFIMELLSYGDRVKVVQPTSLVTRMKKEYENAICNYQ